MTDRERRQRTWKASVFSLSVTHLPASDSAAMSTLSFSESSRALSCRSSFEDTTLKVRSHEMPLRPPSASDRSEE